jgi:uncharacterized protein (DUF1800 family)
MAANTDPAHITSALGRAGFGARPGEAQEIAAHGFAPWVEQQCHPLIGDDPLLETRLADARLRIRYEGTDDMRPLELLDRTMDALWPIADGKTKRDGAERRRPRDEVIAATLLRAVHSRWQLREVLAGFWHDHFNVDFFQSDLLAATLPVYDREVIRPHVLGNFRKMLEAVATSAAMQIYLSNRSSRAGAANENYARELFELHTLGRDAYLNDRYDRWRDVPGAKEGRPSGYIDQDVYEAARAFTGWTIEDGAGVDNRRKLPETGRFAYVESWHDGYQKRVLATEFLPFAAPQADGRQVLDLVANHPATARHLAGKLVHRLVGSRPEKLIAAAAAEWRKAADAPDQIARVVRLILLSPDFMAAKGSCLRRPLALAAAFARATGIDLVPSEGLIHAITACGQRLFGWPTPTGLPDDMAMFLGTQALRGRWALLLGLAENWWGTGLPAIPPALRSSPPTPSTAVAAWTEALGLSDTPHVAAAVLAGLGWPPDQVLKQDTDRKLARIAALCAMAPAFQSA